MASDSRDEQSSSSSCNPLTIFLTRKRSIDFNPRPKGKRQARGEGSTEPKTVSTSQRVKEFVGECLTTSRKDAGKLLHSVLNQN